MRSDATQRLAPLIEPGAGRIARSALDATHPPSEFDADPGAHKGNKSGPRQAAGQLDALLWKSKAADHIE